MKYMGLNELRESFLHFFEERGHVRLPSFSLVPKNDNSLLLINSGMAPMKKFFVGELPPPSRRVTTCQKCVRNNDIENVGFTSRHLTYFEMLGNFSFQDYFKEQAIIWAWAFFTETLRIPKERLHISVYREDQEAYEIWTQRMGIPADHMVRLGKADNFWEHGVGPCGPCSEVYYDRGAENGCADPDCAPGCDCDRFVEVGNIVFSQFESDGQGQYTPMEKPSIDFGMGLERLAMVVQGVDTVFQVDTMRKITEHVERLTHSRHGAEPVKDVSLKIITDHIRSISFMIGDGILASNEGRGYVLRRLIRRAARHGKLLGMDGPFLYQVVDTVIDENRAAYPELQEKRAVITRIVKSEEESFGKTINQGLAVLQRLMRETGNAKRFQGADAFLLNDTYGFPLDLTKEILAEHGIDVDEEKFHELMRRQKERARSARKQGTAWADKDADTQGLPSTKFLGYEQLSCKGKILAIMVQGTSVTSTEGWTEAVLVLDQSPFYAQSGGQAADTGMLTAGDGVARVQTVTKTAGVGEDREEGGGVYLHHVTLAQGRFSVGMEVTATVDRLRRRAIMRNHTAAHLLQAALREILGKHVEQAGQLVDADRVRFDFTHFSALTADELKRVEIQVNQAILEAIPVTVTERSMAEAKAQGAMALFGEKYGERVRVVTVEAVSMELCGGTHVENTAQLGLFRILSESSVAAGVRRIEGVTGLGVIALTEQYHGLLGQTAKLLKSGNLMDLPKKAEQLVRELHQGQKELEQLNAKMAAQRIEGLFEHPLQIGGIDLITGFFSGTGPQTLRDMCDRVRDQDRPMVAVFAGTEKGKMTICATASKRAQERGLKAGTLVKEVALLTGGNGGGRPDFAMAGGKHPERIQEALEKVADLIRQTLEIR